MLLENFYKIIHIKEREDGKQAIEIELNPGHVLYQGHFPGQLFIRLEKTEEHLFKLQAEGICNGKEFIKLKAVLMASKYQ